MQSIRSVREAFARSWIATQIRGAFGSVQPEGPSRTSRRRPRRSDFALEAIEPRLLLSANVNYPDAPNAGDVLVTNLTLGVVDDGGLQVRLTQTGSGNQVFSAAIAATENTINVSRAALPGMFSDTLTIDTASLALLNPTGDALTINFAGGGQDFFKDKVILSSPVPWASTSRSTPTPTSRSHPPPP